MHVVRVPQSHLVLEVVHFFATVSSASLVLGRLATEHTYSLR